MFSLFNILDSEIAVPFIKKVREVFGQRLGRLLFFLPGPEFTDYKAVNEQFRTPEIDITQKYYQ